MATNRVLLFVAGLFAAGLLAQVWTSLNRVPPPAVLPPGVVPPGGRQVGQSEWQWRTQLTAGQFRVARQGDTEGAFSSPLHANHRPGLYRCVCCRNPLFASTTKFDSGTGWPSFFAPVAPNAVYERPDGRRREVRCTVCDAHLGHVFRDGPPPTGLRYCMNGIVLRFEDILPEP
jgi:peptide-methionine (R)-S-oxide reductase